MLPSRIALADTVQSFPPKDTVGPILIDIVRGPILPPRGSKERERMLRVFDNHDYNALWQGARSGLAKKIASVPFSINGPQAKAQYYHDLLGNSHFSRGWLHFIKLAVRDYLAQDYGAIFEIAGPGDPLEPLMAPPTGLNHLDSGRCYVTGNPVYPILYYSLWDGKLHRLHASRVYIMVDDPDPDERYFGIGTCALSRAISIAQREIRMNQYIDIKLDDKPQPGILTLGGMTDQNFQAALRKYTLEQQNDERPVFGRTLILGNPSGEIKIEVIPFAQTPEGFDFVKYVDLDVNALALALGVDRQELWELSGRSLGSGAQSEVLAQKARGKAFGDILAGLERMINWAVLPDDLQFEFKYRDEAENQNQAAIDLQYAQVAQTLAAVPGISTEMILRVLATRSESYKDAFTNELGQVSLPSDDRVPPEEQTNLDDSTPVPEQSNQPAIAPKTQPQQQKAFSSTSAEFITRFADILTRAIRGSVRRGQAENLLLGLLNSSGQKAYADGLREGGVMEALDDDELSQVQDWVVDQIDYLDPLIQSAFNGSIAEGQASTRAEMWANKSLTQMFNAGRISANKNGYYEWRLGKTEQHCPDCQRLNGQVHRLKEWYSRGWLPQSDRLTCKGYRCDCRLGKSQGPGMGRF